jgi:hypothetical protein
MLKIVNSVNKKKILKIVYPWPQYEEESDITHTHASIVSYSFNYELASKKCKIDNNKKKLH